MEDNLCIMHNKRKNSTPKKKKNRRKKMEENKNKLKEYFAIIDESMPEYCTGNCESCLGCVGE